MRSDTSAGREAPAARSARAAAIAHARGPIDEIIGENPDFLRALELARRFATCDAPVLISGESGTGKELVARVVHAESDRSGGEFVAIDCAGLGDAVFESELFGHERGAFTGAVGAKPGLIELADGGTLFLDEIGNMPLHLQAKLLRPLETRLARRVGATRERRCDFRLVCATNSDLERMVDEGRFRLDLLHRISVCHVRLPALRERRDDIPRLIDGLRARLGCACRFDPGAMRALAGARYPGNVRELMNVIRGACAGLSGEPVVTVDDLPAQVRARASDLAITDACDRPVLRLSDIEDGYVRWAAARHRGTRAELAAALGISERSLYRRLRRMRIVPRDVPPHLPSAE